MTLPSLRAAKVSAKSRADENPGGKELFKPFTTFKSSSDRGDSKIGALGSTVQVTSTQLRTAGDHHRSVRQESEGQVSNVPCMSDTMLKSFFCGLFRVTTALGGSECAEKHFE
jgi:hypothetical protein